MLRMLSHVTLYWWVTMNLEIGVLNCKCHTFDNLMKLISVLLTLFLASLWSDALGVTAV